MRNMKNRYLVIDGELNGTGIRDYYGGSYLLLEDLDLTSELKNKIVNWVTRYAEMYYDGFSNNSMIEFLDDEGKEIARFVKNQIPQSKILYFSAAKMTKEII